MTDEPTPATFDAELRQVIGRHNEPYREVPGLLTAMLLQLANEMADTHGIEFDLVEAIDDAWLFRCGESSAVLASDLDPEVLERFDADVAMLDHRSLAGPGGESP